MFPISFGVGLSDCDQVVPGEDGKRASLAYQGMIRRDVLLAVASCGPAMLQDTLEGPAPAGTLYRICSMLEITSSDYAPIRHCPAGSGHVILSEFSRGTRSL